MKRKVKLKNGLKVKDIVQKCKGIKGSRYDKKW